MVGAKQIKSSRVSELRNLEVITLTLSLDIIVTHCVVYLPVLTKLTNYLFTLCTSESPPVVVVGGDLTLIKSGSC